MQLKEEVSIFWFRRDLRLSDNAALFYALKENNNVLPIFIFDTDILSKLDNKEDRRVEFILLALEKIQTELVALKSSLLVIQDKPLQAFEKLAVQFSIKNVFSNHDYEPSAIERDSEITRFLENQNISFSTFKDQVIFEKSDITKDDGLPYTVFTPYMRKWKSKITDFYLKSYPTENYFSNFINRKATPLPSLQDIGFKHTGTTFKIPTIDKGQIQVYDQQRNFPAINGTSHMGIHLRFGTVSIRELVKTAQVLNEQWLNELIWREFFMSILFHFPHVIKGPFKKQYAAIKWRNNEQEFDAWCKGQTGYPIVDAGMRELNETGFMHNRVRMIVASFLVKHLLIDWAWGEAYFSEKLLDYELSANNGNWQWAAGCGCDAAPYFRIFNPYEQTKKFDSKLVYIRKWVPELESFDYPKPIVDHVFARNRVLAAYKAALATAN